MTITVSRLTTIDETGSPRVAQTGVGVTTRSTGVLHGGLGVVDGFPVMRSTRGCVAMSTVSGVSLCGWQGELSPSRLLPVGTSHSVLFATVAGSTRSCLQEMVATPSCTGRTGREVGAYEDGFAVDAVEVSLVFRQLEPLAARYCRTGEATVSERMLRVRGASMSGTSRVCTLALFDEGLVYAFAKSQGRMGCAIYGTFP